MGGIPKWMDGMENNGTYCFKWIIYIYISYIYIPSYGHLLVLSGNFYLIIHSINGVLLVIITGRGPN